MSGALPGGVLSNRGGLGAGHQQGGQPRVVSLQHAHEAFKGVRPTFGQQLQHLVDLLRLRPLRLGKKRGCELSPCRW